MPEENNKAIDVAVLGAGPAGIFAAKKLADAGLDVALINRDIKPGGLAEYGIFHNKHKMKAGLRKQFRRVMAHPNVHYFGNLTVGDDEAIEFRHLQELGFGAILITVGAQGTKWLGLPGEDLEGVFHAKDLVYHYNKLPPFSEGQFAIGKKVLCVGVGNVMLDIAHWSIRDLSVDEVIAVARRGPADVKFTKKEMQIVAKNLDLNALDAEIERTREIMLAAEQDPEAAKNFIVSALEKAQEPISDTRFRFEFLSSPQELIGDEDGRVRAVRVNDTRLELRDGGGTKAVNTGSSREIEADTVVFCIGDKVDSELGLPLNQWNEFAKHPQPKFPVDETSYEAYDPKTEQGLKGVFLAGWAREASSGLVGSARKDGNNGAEAMLAYLEQSNAGSRGPIEQLKHKAAALNLALFDKADIAQLEAEEERMAEEQGIEEYKFSSNAEMMGALGKVATE
jgi:ferredoxin--NADP+ reductase